MDQFPLDLQVWIPWVCKKLFLIRHENLSGPDFTPRQLPGSRQPRLDDGPVFHPKRRSSSLSFVFRAFAYLVHFRFSSGQPFSPHDRPLRYFSRRVVGEPYASFARPSPVLSGFPPFHPLLYSPPLVGLFTATPLHTPSFSAPLFAPVCRHAYGGFSRYTLIASFTRRTLAKSFEVLPRPYPLHSPTRGC